MAGGIGGFFFSGLILGGLFGWRMCRNRDGRKALEILEKEINKPQKEDSGKALIQLFEEKSIPDTAKLDIKFIKDWINNELKRTGRNI
jgi:hypothetical protein